MQPILRAASACAERLVDFSERRDDVVRPAKLPYGKLNARPSRLLGLEEDEFVLVRNDHLDFCPASQLARSSRIAPKWISGTLSAAAMSWSFLRSSPAMRSSASSTR